MEIPSANPQRPIGDLLMHVLFFSWEFHMQVVKQRKVLLEVPGLTSTRIGFTSCWYVFPMLTFKENPENS